MAKLSLSRDHNLPVETLRERITTLQTQLKEKYSANSKWADDNTLAFDGPGVDGKVLLNPNKVEIDLDYGLLLRPFKSKIEEGLNRELDRLTQA